MTTETETEVHGYEFISISWAGTSKSGKTNTYSVTNNSARCPLHDDSTPSLTVNEGRDVAVILHCFAGCSPDAILAELGLEWRDLKDDRRRGWA